MEKKSFVCHSLRAVPQNKNSKDLPIPLSTSSGKENKKKEQNGSEQGEKHIWGNEWHSNIKQKSAKGTTDIKKTSS